MHVKSAEDVLVTEMVGAGLVQSKVEAATDLMMVLAEKTVAAIDFYVVVAGGGDTAAAGDTAAVDFAVAAFVVAVAVNTPEWPHQIYIPGL